MNIWFISDTHGRHRELTVPDHDLVIFCGDESSSREANENEQETREFMNWFTSLPSHRIMIPGNHSLSFANGRVRREDWDCEVLINESTSFRGLKIWGSPYSPRYGDWSFGIKRNRADVLWNLIPTDTNILVTHGPPKGILDLTCNLRGVLEQVGCASLHRHVDRVKPLVHAFGHIHDESGIRNFASLDRYGVKYMNCSAVINGKKDLNGGHLIRVVDDGVLA